MLKGGLDCCYRRNERNLTEAFIQPEKTGIREMVVTVLLYLGIAIVGTAIIWKGSSLLERSSEQLSIHYGLPPIVQGAIVAAVGSSFPELSSVVISTLLHGTFDLGVSAIVGSAIFNILIIPAAAALVTPQTLDSSKDVVYKDAQFYVFSVAVLLLTFSLAMIYNPVSGTEHLTARVTRVLALLPIAAYAFYVFLQYLDTQDHDPDDTERDINAARQWVSLVVSLLVILIGVEMLVKSAIKFGDLFNTPEILWGLTVVAAGTSLPDALVSIRAARNTAGVTSIANVLGSNIFDLLIAVPAGVMIAGVATINYSAAIPLMGFLMLATLALFTVTRTGLTMTNREAHGLLALYAVFILWMSLEVFNVVNLVPGV